MTKISPLCKLTRAAKPVAGKLALFSVDVPASECAEKIMYRIDRLTAMILMLQSQRVLTAEKMASHFEVSVRTAIGTCWHWGKLVCRL